MSFPIFRCAKNQKPHLAPTSVPQSAFLRRFFCHLRHKAISKEIQEEWISTFGLKNIEDSIEIALPDVVGEKIGKNIRINVGSLLKMVAQKREKYIGELAKVLEKPELVLGDDTILILARH